MEAQNQTIRVIGEQGEGSIAIGSENVTINCGVNISVPHSYITLIEKGERLPLGKVAVVMDVYDMFGERHRLHLAMADHAVEILKKAIGQNRPDQ